jgi:ATP synthase protein I
MQSDPWADSQTEQAEQDASFIPLNRQQAQALQAQLGSLCLSCALWVQALLAAMLVVVVGFWGDGAYAFSVLAGVLLAWLPQCLLVFAVGRKIGQVSAPAWLLHLFVWEAAKWVLTLVLMALVAVWVRDVSWLALLLAFIFTLKAGWGVLFVQHVRRGASAGAVFQGEQK